MLEGLPQNEVALSLGEVASATGGVLAGSPSIKVRGVATDSRKSMPGALFVALTGERFDGHAFTSAAVLNGAAALLVEREMPDAKLPVVQVKSTLAALGALGLFRRRTWGGKLIAVAGSAGKTTTRAALAALLEAAEPSATHFVRGNFNNLIGVPLVLLSLRAEERIAVVEIGTNRPGEVAALTRLSEPDVAVLTLIGYEHTEGLRDLDGIEAEEGALFQNLSERSLAVGNVDEERVARQLASAPGRRLSYGMAPGAEYRFQLLAQSERGCELLVERSLSGRRVRTSFRTSALGEAGAYAACATLAAVEGLLDREISAATLNAAFASSLASEAGRLCPVQLSDGTLLLDDTYNSNPESVESSIRTARKIADQRQSRLVLVLGEMRELGELSAELHARVGRAAAAATPALVIAIAGDARLISQAAGEGGAHTELVSDADAAAELLLQVVQPRDVVLVKASRGVQAERVVVRLTSAKGRAE